VDELLIMRIHRALCCWLYAAVNIVLLTAAPAARFPSRRFACVQKGIQAQWVEASSAKSSVRRRRASHLQLRDQQGCRSTECTLDEAGALVSMEVALVDTPMVVQRTIQTQSGQNRWRASKRRSRWEGELRGDLESQRTAEHSFTVLEGRQAGQCAIHVGRNATGGERDHRQGSRPGPGEGDLQDFRGNVASYT